MRLALPFDGSDSANNALAYVLSLTKDTKGTDEVHLINVQDATVGLDELFDDSADIAERLVKTSREAGAKLLAKPVAALKRAGAKTKTAVIIGDPASCVAEYIDDNRCDAVVMGTRGLGQVAGLVLGSVASKVIHLVKVPITLVK